MPIPSFAEGMYKEGLAEGREEGRDQEREGILAGLIRHRFGPDERIPAIARRLATLDLDEYLARIDRASGLDDLAIGD
jgi:hypothetical protein